MTSENLAVVAKCCDNRRMSADPVQPAVLPEEEATLRPGAIGFIDALVIGLASTSPAYSLAAILGALVALTGLSLIHI